MGDQISLRISANVAVQFFCVASLIFGESDYARHAALREDNTLEAISVVQLIIVAIIVFLLTPHGGDGEELDQVLWGAEAKRFSHAAPFQSAATG